MLYSGLAASNAYRNGLESAAQVRCPALFVLGGRDSMTPARSADELIKALKSAGSVQVSASGHSLMAEAPDATLDALIEFILGASAGRRGGTT